MPVTVALAVYRVRFIVSVTVALAVYRVRFTVAQLFIVL